MLRTTFWRKAASSLPAAVRARHLGHFEDAERFELFLEAAIEGCRRVNRIFQVSQPRAR